MSGFQTGRVSVWWDLHTCAVPQNVDPSYVAKNVSAMLQNACLLGPATIDAFGNTKRLSRKVLEGLSSTGINLNHIPNGTRDAADKAILVALLLWALDNSPPASLVLISGDGDFANALHRLRLKGYNVLLVQPDQPVNLALLRAASTIWYWTSVLNGQTFRDDETATGQQQRWISVNDMVYEFPDNLWMDLGRFLCCSETNRQLVVKTPSRFEAARALKCCGPARIKDLIMGHIILLLNQSIQKKKWLRTCRKGWPSIVIDLPGIETFLKSIAQTQGTQAAHLGQHVAGSSKLAQKLKIDLSNTREEAPSCTIVQQRVKKWLLQLPNTSKGYGLPFIQKGLIKDANIFMGQKELEDMISRFSEDFELERNKDAFPLVFQKRHASVLAAKKHIQTDLASGAGLSKQPKRGENTSIAANAEPQEDDQSAEGVLSGPLSQRFVYSGKLGEYKGVQTHSVPKLPFVPLNAGVVYSGKLGKCKGVQTHSVPKLLFVGTLCTALLLWIPIIGFLVYWYARNKV